MADTALSASDVAMLNGRNNMMGDGGSWMIWLFAILALFGGGGFAFGGGGNSNAIQADVNRGFDNQNLQAQTRDILSAVTGGTAQTIAASTANATNAINAIKDGNASLIREFGNVETALTSLAGQQQQCCGDLKMLVQGVASTTDAAIAAAKYETAMQLAGMEQRITAKMDANTIQGLRDQVDALRDQVNMSGVLRFPNQWSYGAGPFPPIMGCGCNA